MARKKKAVAHNRNGFTYLGGVRVKEETLAHIRDIAIRREEIVSNVVEKALARYVAEDIRLRERSRGQQH